MDLVRSHKQEAFEGLFTKLAEISVAAIQFKRNKVLGRGSFGTVYKGVWGGSRVALKLLRIQDPSNLVDFYKEAKLMASLHHNNLVKLYGVVRVGEELGMVMEFCQGGGLDKRLRIKEETSGGYLTWPNKLQIAEQMCEGLVFLHGKGILHRDLKSLNVLLDSHNNAKLADFGLSRTMSGSIAATVTQQTGTPAWMAPELFSNQPKYTCACDLYSLGVTFWEMASGQFPFQGADSPHQVAMWVSRGEKPQSATTGGAPPQWMKWVECMWDTNPNNRPSIETVLGWVKHFLSSSSLDSSSHSTTLNSCLPSSSPPSSFEEFPSFSSLGPLLPQTNNESGGAPPTQGNLVHSGVSPVGVDLGVSLTSPLPLPLGQGGMGRGGMGVGQPDQQQEQLFGMGRGDMRGINQMGLGSEGGMRMGQQPYHQQFGLGRGDRRGLNQMGSGRNEWGE